MLQVRRAKIADFDTVVGLVDEASLWLRTKETDQWGEPWPSQAERDGRIKKGLRRGETWIAEFIEDGRKTPVGTVSLRSKGNRTLWERHELRQRACYLSRLVVHRDFSGQAIGGVLIDWAAQRSQRLHRAQVVRIDVWTTNTALHRVYLDYGFRFLRYADAPSYPSAALFERPITPVGPMAVNLTFEIPKFRHLPRLALALARRVFGGNGQHNHSA